MTVNAVAFLGVTRTLTGGAEGAVNLRIKCIKVKFEFHLKKKAIKIEKQRAQDRYMMKRTSRTLSNKKKILKSK